MAITETTGTIKYKDSNGDITLMYPVTRKECVDGMDDVDAHLANENNPHNVTAAQIGALSSSPISMASTDGASYTCEVPGINALTVGASFIGIPALESTSKSVNLNVNNLGDKYLRRRVSTGTGITSAGCTESWISANKPIKIIYDGTFWLVDNVTQASAQDLMGNVPTDKGGTGASDGATGLANLFAAGYTVLSSYQYGDTLPEPGVSGRIFFKKVGS